MKVHCSKSATNGTRKALWQSVASALVPNLKLRQGRVKVGEYVTPYETKMMLKVPREKGGSSVLMSDWLDQGRLADT